METELASLLLPGTDRGVLLEALAAAGIFTVALVVTWRDREWRLVVLGVAVCVFAFFAFRALH